MKRIIRYIRSLHPLAAIVLRGCQLVSIAQTLAAGVLYMHAWAEPLLRSAQLIHAREMFCLVPVVLLEGVVCTALIDRYAKTCEQ